jgi:DNA-binding Lrp family transcriptional regulator
VTTTKGKMVEIEDEIAKVENVCAVYDITGTADIMVTVETFSLCANCLADCRASTRRCLRIFSSFSSKSMLSIR